MIKVIFYKHSGTFFDKLIRLWTRGPYSHTEIVDTDGTIYSADSRNNKVRGLSGYDIYNGHWDIVEVPELDNDKAIKFIKSQLNKEYDWKGILFSQILSLELHSRNKWFCSEICFVALKKAGLQCREKPQDIHPNKLFEILTEKFNGKVIKV